GRVEDVVSKAGLRGDELADESADHREDDAGFQAVEDVRRDRRNDDVGEDLATVRSHDASLVDEVGLDLLDAGKHRIKHQEKYHRDDNRDLRPAADAAGDRADGITEHDLPEGDRGIGPYRATSCFIEQVSENFAGLPDEARVERE